MSIADVAARLDAMLEVVDAARASLNAATTSLDDAKGILSDTLSGSSRFEVDELLRRYTDITQDVDDLSGAVDAAETATRDLRARLVDAAATAGVPTNATDRPAQSPQAPATPLSVPAPVTSDLIERLRDELPPAVVRGTGQKTHGRWIGPDGVVHEEVSGKDQKFRDTLRYFQEELKSTRIPSIITHVEAKLAHYMRSNEIRAASLVINNRPCEGDMGCDKLLPAILPPGYTLTVYGPDGFRQEYRGGGR